MVEHRLAKARVGGSNPLSRSNLSYNAPLDLNARPGIPKGVCPFRGVTGAKRRREGRRVSRRWGCSKGMFPLRGVTGPVVRAVLGAEPLGKQGTKSVLRGVAPWRETAQTGVGVGRRRRGFKSPFPLQFSANAADGFELLTGDSERRVPIVRCFHSTGTRSGTSTRCQGGASSLM